MKKLLLFLLSICCAIPAKAQNVNNYNQKLDSVYYGNGVERLQYDDRYNCTKIQLVEYGVNGQEIVFSTKEYTYDELNRVIRDEYTEMTGFYNLYEDSYNEQGLVAQKIRTMKYHDEYVEIYKYTYEYDTNGNLLIHKGYWLEDNNEWTESYRHEYFYADGLLVTIKRYSSTSNWNNVTNYYYNEQGLCVEKITKNGSEVTDKVLYTYEESGRKTSETKMSLEEQELVFTKKTEWEFDAEGNCANLTYFEYNKYDENWLFFSSFQYAYDLSNPINGIAGFSTYWDNSRFEPKYKILNYQKLDYNEYSYTVTFHYSETTGVEENSGNLVCIWPNPVSEMLHLDIENPKQVEILTLDGKLVLTSKNANPICVSGLSQGCYLLKITLSDGNMSFQKFVKE